MEFLKDVRATIETHSPDHIVVLIFFILLCLAVLFFVCKSYTDTCFHPAALHYPAYQSVVNYGAVKDLTPPPSYNDVEIHPPKYSSLFPRKFGSYSWVRSDEDSDFEMPPAPATTTVVLTHTK